MSTFLEFKVSHDDQHIYLYARVAGQVGRTHPDGGRSYFYAYMDVDQNPGTGFLPSRDDECYFGVDIGDDCEVQFEFVNNAFRKSFYGFCGLGGDDNVLKQQLTSVKAAMAGSTITASNGQTTNQNTPIAMESPRSPRTLSSAPVTPFVWPYRPTGTKSRSRPPSPVS